MFAPEEQPVYRKNTISELKARLINIIKCRNQIWRAIEETLYRFSFVAHHTDVVHLNIIVLGALIFISTCIL